MDLNNRLHLPLASPNAAAAALVEEAEAVDKLAAVAGLVVANPVLDHPVADHPAGDRSAGVEELFIQVVDSVEMAGYTRRLLTPLAALEAILVRTVAVLFEAEIRRAAFESMVLGAVKSAFQHQIELHRCLIQIRAASGR